MKIGNKEPHAIYVGKYVVTYIMRGITVLWQNIKSCFGAGFWNNNKPWDNIEGWKNN